LRAGSAEKEPTVKRKALYLLFALAVVRPRHVGCAGNQALHAADKPLANAPVAAIDPLLFPKDSYAEETKKMKTSAGERNVTYRSYKHIPHVANPVDSARSPASLNRTSQIEFADSAALPLLIRLYAIP
jgi:hypothetical protein